MVTGDTHHGFEQIPLLDKVAGLDKDQQGRTNAYRKGGEPLNEHPELFDYSSVRFVPLGKAVDEDELAKLQSIMSCLHTVRSRYEKGVNTLRVALSVVDLNADMNLTSMFCSDFVGYVAYEMGWMVPPDDLIPSSKNLSPQDFVRMMDQAAWEGKRAWDLDIASAVLAKEMQGDSNNKVHFPSDAAAYWQKRNLQYENQLRSCRPRLLTYLQSFFPYAYHNFQLALADEIRSQRLWDGQGVWEEPDGYQERVYIRLVVEIALSGEKEVKVYKGSLGDGWKSNYDLSSHTLDTSTLRNIVHKPSVDGTDWTFSFLLEGEQEMHVFKLQPSSHGVRNLGLYFSAIAKQAKEWLFRRPTLSMLEQKRRAIWVYPTDDIEVLKKAKRGKFPLPVETWSGAKGEFSVSHVLYNSRPEPAVVVVH
eukprot:TRINITY_DN72706_c0_g1_i3.p1 TRINITY_DN72706_c0_g1~~TRINITY_DN72706_c0_g1_i3.p1  ORF type:complete len:419 (+),score=45.66 TRINITY_DN72706_c0_g1_i3:483-1739(+)